MQYVFLIRSSAGGKKYVTRRYISQTCTIYQMMLFPMISSDP